MHARIQQRPVRDDHRRRRQRLHPRRQPDPQAHAAGRVPHREQQRHQPPRQQHLHLGLMGRLRRDHQHHQRHHRQPGQVRPPLHPQLGAHPLRSRRGRRQAPRGRLALARNLDAALQQHVRPLAAERRDRHHGEPRQQLHVPAGRQRGHQLDVTLGPRRRER